jgi:hypothetical protein
MIVSDGDLLRPPPPFRGAEITIKESELHLWRRLSESEPPPWGVLFPE